MLWFYTLPCLLHLAFSSSCFRYLLISQDWLCATLLRSLEAGQSVHFLSIHLVVKALACQCLQPEIRNPANRTTQTYSWSHLGQLCKHVWSQDGRDRKDLRLHLVSDFLFSTSVIGTMVWRLHHPIHSLWGQVLVVLQHCCLKHFHSFVFVPKSTLWPSHWGNLQIWFVTLLLETVGQRFITST